MTKTVEILLATIILTLCLTKAAGEPIEGTWEGMYTGQGGIRLEFSHVDGHLVGSMISWVVLAKRGDPPSPHHRSARKRSQRSQLGWQIIALCHLRPPIAYEMTLTSPNSAVLKRLPNPIAPIATVQMQRRLVDSSPVCASL
jgi:hypothetical protein